MKKILILAGVLFVGYKMFGSSTDDDKKLLTNGDFTDISKWVFLGKEYDPFVLTTASKVAYGTQGSLITKELQPGNYVASNELFGTDPAPGMGKNVWVYKG